MSRSRFVFFVIIGLAVLFVVGATMLQNAQRSSDSIAATAAIRSTLTAVGIPNNNATSITPIFAGGKPPADALPTYVCAADAFGSYYTLQEMQVAGYDVENGFHLGIVPFLLDGAGGAYDISEDARTQLLESGNIDCLFTTLDSAALKGTGTITAVIDESAGADQLWVRGEVKTLNDLRGKRIAYAEGSVGQFFVLYAVAVAGLNPRTDMTMVPSDSVTDAVKRFNSGQADVVSGWQPDIQAASQAGGANLIGSDKLRVVVDVIMTARPSIQKKSKVVQAFHDAWFRTLKAQFEDFPKAAQQVAAWGNNEWSGISPQTAEKDMGQQLALIAQGSLTQNAAIMRDPARLIERLETARRVWAAAGQVPSTVSPSDLINPQFVLQSVTRSDLATAGQPHNTSFILGSRPDLRELAPDEGETLAVLPCRKFDFLPESAELTSESRRLLDTCVLPVLNSSIGIYLQVVGSAAWPGPEGTFKEEDIRSVAESRAKAVVDYLVKNGLDPKRFKISAVLPPPERRNITDGLEQSKDRYVEMTLITIGR